MFICLSDFVTDTKPYRCVVESKLKAKFENGHCETHECSCQNVVNSI